MESELKTLRKTTKTVEESVFDRLNLSAARYTAKVNPYQIHAINVT